jgi:hypothetical protein
MSVKITDPGGTGIFVDWESMTIGREPGSTTSLTTDEKMQAFARIDKIARELGLPMPKVKIKEAPQMASPLIRAALAAVNEDGEA